MKRILCIICMMLICVGCVGGALADDREIDSPFFQCAHWKPEDVDVSGVREENGRLVGVVKLPAVDKYGRPAAELRVDCPMPTDFTAEQRVMLHVRYKKLSKQDVCDALKALGQKASIDDMWYYNNADQSTVDFTSEQDIDGCCYWGQFCDVSRSDDPACADEYAQAKDTVRKLVESLGGAACERLLHANRSDSAHAYRYSDTATSEGDKGRKSWEESFAKSEADKGRTDEPYTTVIGLYELLGLPMTDQYYWKDDGDWMGASCGYQAVVRDDGAVCYLQINSVPEIVSAEPVELPAFDWRALLKHAAAYLSISNATSTEQSYTNRDGENCVAYPSYGIITDLKPCWVSKERGVFVPGWYCVTEERVMKDDSVIYPWSQYGDYIGLMEE